MGLFRRSRTAVQVRVLATEPPQMRVERRFAFRRREHPRRMRLEVRFPDGAVHEVERQMWVPEWVGVEQLVSSGRTLEATCPLGAPGDLTIEWEQIEQDVTADVFAKLFHKQGPPEERLALLEQLYAGGQFKDELYAKARRELLEEIGA